MRFDIVTIFPGLFARILEYGVLRRALAEGLVTVNLHDLRVFTHDRHRTVDDRPFGGGEGMVLKPEPIAEALAFLGIQPKTPRESPPVPGMSATEKPASDPGGMDFTGCETTRSEDSFVTGHDFSRADRAPIEIAGALAPAQEGTGFIPDILDTGRSMLAKTSAQDNDASGHDFSRVDQAPNESPGALAPAQGTGFSPYIQPGEKSGALAPEGIPPANRRRVILLSAQGRPFTQQAAREIAKIDQAVLICGRYEGVDERINQLFCDEELSIGDYVLSGGELAAAVVVDAVTRLIPGVLGNEASSEFESFGAEDAAIETDEAGVPRSQHGSGGLLDYPHFTRPAEFQGVRVPDVLLNGDHAQIRRWRREQQLRKTLANRPDLLERAQLSAEDRAILDSIRAQRTSDPTARSSP